MVTEEHASGLKLTVHVGSARGLKKVYMQQDFIAMYRESERNEHLT